MSPTHSLLGALAGVTLTLAASGLAPEAPEPPSQTITATVDRLGGGGGDRLATDQGVQDMNALLATVLASTAPDDLFRDVEQALVEAYGADSVTLQAEPQTNYIYVWDAEKQVWTIRCIEADRHLVEDGGPQALAVTVGIEVLNP